MSIVSSVFSSRSSEWGINARAASIMDSIFAIGFGLGLRFVVDLVSHHDFKLTGTLVGLWEGVVMLHFLKKMPSSFDPYVAYGVRMFIDFLVTESVSRMILVVVWTGLGMVLADITPSLWKDVGLNRIWRRFRRDMYTISRSIPKVAFFPRARTVRFIPYEPPSAVSPTSSTITISPSTVTQAPLPPLSTNDVPPISLTPAPRKRRIPGSFQSEISETDTEMGSVLGFRRQRATEGRSTHGTAHYRFSTMPKSYPSEDTPTEGSSSMSRDDLDEGNLSSDLSSESEVIDPSSVNVEIPEIEETQVVDKGKKPADADRDITPKAKPLVLPPTPSSQLPEFKLDKEPPPPPLPAVIHDIPDTFDAGGFSDWETVQKEEAIEYVAPPVLSKNDLEPTTFKSPPPLPHPVPSVTEQVLSPRQEFANDWLDASTPIVESLSQNKPKKLEIHLSTVPDPSQIQPAPPAYKDFSEIDFSTKPPAQAQDSHDPNANAINVTTNQNNDLPIKTTGPPDATEGGNLIDVTEEDTQIQQTANDKVEGQNEKTTSDPPAQEECLNKTQDDTTNQNENKETTPPLKPDSPENNNNEDQTEQTQNQAQDGESKTPMQRTSELGQEKPSAVTNPAEEKVSNQEQQQEAGPSVAESIVSEVSEFNENVTTRLNKAILLAAQMVEMKKTIRELTRQKASALADGGAAGAALAVQKDSEIQKAEKALGKMKRKAEKRYEAVLDESGTSIPEFFDLWHEGPEDFRAEVETALELLLKPGAESLNCILQVGTKKVGKAQKAILQGLLNDYHLTATNPPGKMRQYIINLTETEYEDWLSKYRTEFTHNS